MPQTMNDILHPTQSSPANPDFPHAPEGWNETLATELARDEGIAPEADHWEAIRAIQEYASRSERIQVRALHDALDERFHERGGIRHLYELFPGGPVAQGCRIAGLEPPAGSSDPSFGSVQ
jgi:tRNA 2-thiouridine synthesizing protein E